MRHKSFWLIFFGLPNLRKEGKERRINGNGNGRNFTCNELWNGESSPSPQSTLIALPSTTTETGIKACPGALEEEFITLFAQILDDSSMQNKFRSASYSMHASLISSSYSLSCSMMSFLATSTFLITPGAVRRMQQFSVSQKFKNL
jgi:hypothetical protein